MRPEDIRFIFIHCSATKASQDVDAAWIDAVHKAKGWSGIGYHYFIKRDGTLEVGRLETKQGAHVGGFGLNHCSLGICLSGGLNEDTGGPLEGWGYTYTSSQETTLIQLLTAQHARFPEAIILGHRDGSPDLDGDGSIQPHEWVKACPCFSVADFLESREILRPYK